MSDYPQDCIQNLASSWWEADTAKTVCRGSLVLAYVQFFSQIPFELVSERVEAENHQTAFMKMRPLFTGGRRTGAPPLPVAAMPRLEGADCFIANRAKRRPCLVLGAVERHEAMVSLTKGMSKCASDEFFLVAPYYSVEQAARAGYNELFVERIRHAQYNRFFWDMLPGPSGHESILRLDQTQPVGFHHQSYEPLGFRLSNDALRLTDEWMNWLFYGTVGENIRAFRDLLQGVV